MCGNQTAAPFYCRSRHLSGRDQYKCEYVWAFEPPSAGLLQIQVQRDTSRGMINSGFVYTQGANPNGPAVWLLVEVRRGGERRGCLYRRGAPRGGEEGLLQAQGVRGSGGEEAA